MSSESPPTYDQILATVVTWPEETRRALVRDVLQTIDAEPVRSRQRREALRQLEGILATVSPPPSDEDLRRWLDERRMEKYG